MSEAARALSEEQVAQVFRALARDHSQKRAALERELAWRCIASRAREKARRRGGWLSRLALPAAAAICVLCAVVGWTYRPMLEYELVGTATVMDGEVRAGLGGASLVFSDGSTVLAREDSVLSLSVVGQQAVLTRLVRGGLGATVRHDERSDWRFLAGPYEIRVVGTTFDVSWEPEPAVLSISMHQGSVRVTGPGKFDRTLSAGETLERTGAEQEPIRVMQPESEQSMGVKPRREEVFSSSPIVGKPAAQEDPGPGRAAGARTPAPRRHLATPPLPSGFAPVLPPEDDWPLLVSRGKFEEVVEAAGRAGIDDVLSSNGVDDLKALAQAARYTGYTALALRSWVGIRERFGGHPAALHAAFFIGRIYDEMDERSRARKWLDTYLFEAPEGTYASEALGRRLGLSRRMNEVDDTRRLARHYLERFPTGAYARAARGVLSDPAQPVPPSL